MCTADGGNCWWRLSTPEGLPPHLTHSPPPTPGKGETRETKQRRRPGPGGGSRSWKRRAGGGAGWRCESILPPCPADNARSPGLEKRRPRTAPEIMPGLSASALISPKKEKATVNQKSEPGNHSLALKLGKCLAPVASFDCPSQLQNKTKPNPDSFVLRNSNPDEYTCICLQGTEDVMELLEEDLTCPICCSLFDDPRVLPCSHNFCRKCLEGILEGTVRNSLWRSSPFKCPTCRKETSATGVNSLQVNYSLKGIVEKYNKIKISPKMPVCKGHLGQPLNIFCLTDMQLICGICATRGDHTKHVFCSIEDAYAQERDAFESLFQSFETWRRGDALSRLDTLETSKRKSLQLLTKDSDKVKEFFEKLQHTLDQKKNEILSDFETMKLAVMQAYDPEINKLNTILQEQRMAFNIAEAFKDVSEPIIFLQQMQEFREKIKVIKETPLPPSNLPTSPLMKNFDTSQWEDIKLVDVDKLSLPQDTGTFVSKIPWSFSHFLVVVILLSFLTFFGPTIFLEGSLFDEFTTWKDHLSNFNSYLAKSADFVEQSMFYWEQVTDGFFIFSERFKNITLLVLNNVAEFVCKYKLL
ncbi:E3 ubiquitin-protein ligase TRIM13 isoform X1 [Suricata suricatta]|uniref:E3 ubiquitin-protein ligase TRIM13 n=2 Tax=Suricata suricatta TaxID=37032 RepID=A0A673SK83_SURSU|nr:E3 ubiquitin-protein ligase TRIM13 isoform X1 [Suricata suricatta]XP_029792665.1 E3 ubiquitin-protein ligase TRIM13 isoform X1 [Suricata suricatta]